MYNDIEVLSITILPAYKLTNNKLSTGTGYEPLTVVVCATAYINIRGYTMHRMK